MNHFNLRKSISVFLASALLVSALPVSASALEANTEKEEVVYVNLGNDGSVREINVVNIFERIQRAKLLTMENIWMCGI